MGSEQVCLINNVKHDCEQLDSWTVQITASTLIPARSRLKIKVPNISNPSSPTGTSYFTIYSQHANGNQIIDMNDSFGIIGFAQSITAITGTISLETASTSVVNVLSNYRITFTLSGPIPSQSVFRIYVPNPYIIKEFSSCSLLTSNSISGDFACTIVEDNLLLSGLSSIIPSGTEISIKLVNIMNPSYTISSSVVDFTVETMIENSNILVHRITASNLAGVSGAIKDITHAAYTPYSRFINGNSLYTLLSFKTSTIVSQGGYIELVYDTDIDLDSCLVLSGVPNNSAGSRPTCTPSGSTIEISNFGLIAANTVIKVANYVTNLSGNIDYVTITTNDKDGNIIDKELTKGNIVTESIDTFNSATVNYESSALSAGSVTIFFKPEIDVIDSEILTVYLPTNFTIPSSESLTCKIQGNTPGSCVLIAQIITITIDDDTSFTALDGGTIVLDTNGNGLVYPTIGSSKSNIIEWVVDITHTGSQYESGTILSELDNGGFALSNTATKLEYTGETDTYAPYKFIIKTELELKDTSTRKHELKITFPAEYSNDLGTGLIVTGSMPIYDSTIDLDCKLSPGTLPVIKFTNFESVESGDIFSFTLFIKNGATVASSDIEIETSYEDLNGIITILQSSNIPITLVSDSVVWDTLELDN